MKKPRERQTVTKTSAVSRGYFFARNLSWAALFIPTLFTP